jgi:hypothetical protein
MKQIRALDGRDRQKLSIVAGNLMEKVEVSRKKSIKAH